MRVRGRFTDGSPTSSGPARTWACPSNGGTGPLPRSSRPCSLPLASATSGARSESCPGNGVARILPLAQVDGSSFGLEMLMLAVIGRAKIVQVPVNYHPRVGRSSVTGNRWKAIRLGPADGLHGAAYASGRRPTDRADSVQPCAERHRCWVLPPLGPRAASCFDEHDRIHHLSSGAVSPFRHLPQDLVGDLGDGVLADRRAVHVGQMRGRSPRWSTAVPRVQVKAVAAPLRRPPGPGRGQP